ncbi:MAG: DUF3307 domain-containing protein [Candidatus Hydrothermales bacterium]
MGNKGRELNSFFFWHLTFAHFLTDYPLQTDKLFEKKTKDIWGIFIHGLVLFLTMFLLLLPFSFSSVVILGISVITLLHIVQDKLKVFLSYKDELGENFFYYIVDQFVHIFIIFIFSKFFPFPKVNGNSFWFDSFLFKIFTFLIVVTYAYWILLYSIEYTFFKHNDLVHGKMKIWGFIERAFVFLSYFINPFLSFLSFLSTIFLFFFSPKNEKKFFIIFRSFTGIVLTIFTSLIFYNFLL